jgi:hypothetical protein
VVPLNDLVFPSTNSFAPSASHIVEWNEIYGQVDGIQPVDDETVRVQIGQTAVLLPSKLKLSVGRRVFMARIDISEYVAWVVPEEEHVPPAQPICQAGFTLDEICREIESGNLIAFLKNRLGDRVDLSCLNFPTLTAPDAERLGVDDHSSVSAGSEPLTQTVLEQNHKVRGKNATAKPQARAKAGVRRVRA